MRQEAKRSARQRPLWQVALAFFVCMGVVNLGMRVLLQESHYIEVTESWRVPVSPILFANGDLRLAGWMNPAGHTDKLPTVVGSYRRLLERARDGAEEELPSIGVATVVDPRTLASDCIRLQKERKSCVAEALEYYEVLRGLTDAPLHLPIPLPMAPQNSPRSEVLTCHHTISCWPLEQGRGSQESVTDITAEGGRCVLMVDALDAHAYPEFTNAVLHWFIDQDGSHQEEQLVNTTGSGGRPFEAEQGRGSLSINGRHHFYLATMDGKWGDFNDVLVEKELEEIESASWQWLLENSLAAEPEDVFFMFIMYAEGKLNIWKQNIEAMALSLKKNGGQMARASGAILVYTPHGEKQPDLSVLVPLLGESNIEIVYMPTPWKEDMSNAWTLHFLKTDLVSYEEGWNRKIVVYLDLDMLILGDLMPYVSPRHLRMTPATTVVPLQLGDWKRHGFQSEGEHVMHHFNTMEPAYYNSGVMMGPSNIFKAFLKQTEREAEIELESGHHDLLNRDQVMFEFAHYSLDTPFLELPHDVNLDSALAQDLACQVVTEPIVYHYHRNPLLNGIPPIPPSTCPAYGKLRHSLLGLKESYPENKVLNRRGQ